VNLHLIVIIFLGYFEYAAHHEADNQIQSCFHNVVSK